MAAELSRVLMCVVWFLVCLCVSAFSGWCFHDGVSIVNVFCFQLNVAL